MTRMGHPGAPNHDHHRSIWFAHHDVQGVDFWSEGKPARIRQSEWLCYHDGEDEAVMAVKLLWSDGHDARPLLEQELIAGVRPVGQGETLLELQTHFKPTAESIEFGKTNFGFLAVRMAKALSGHFGTGILTNSEGVEGEPKLFAQPSLWVDYSGTQPGEAGDLAEGITYFDHPTNPGHPNSWHVREDGWMGCAVHLRESMVVRRAEPLQLRFLLHAHQGNYDADKAKSVFLEFSKSPEYRLVKAPQKHTAYGVERAS